MFYDQSDFDIRCDWGLPGLLALAPISDVVIIVDVLSFSTCVDIATRRGGIVYPYPWGEEGLDEFCETRGAIAAGGRGDEGFSLSPTSLLDIPRGTKLVLPSPNGSTLTLSTDKVPTLAGSLRNASAVARAASRMGKRIAVISAGERWPDGSMRPAVEDLIGAGAVIAELEGTRSPEAASALAVFQQSQAALAPTIARCASGRELFDRGFGNDVVLATELNVSDVCPILRDGAYVASE